MTYLCARCNCTLRLSFRFYCVFGVFSYIIDEHLCLKCCIFIKLSQIVCLIYVHILICQHAKCDCRFSDLIAFLGNFHILLHVWHVVTSSLTGKPHLPCTITPKHSIWHEKHYPCCTKNQTNNNKVFVYWGILMATRNFHIIWVTKV